VAHWLTVLWAVFAAARHSVLLVLKLIGDVSNWPECFKSTIIPLVLDAQIASSANISSKSGIPDPGSYGCPSSRRTATWMTTQPPNARKRELPPDSHTSSETQGAKEPEAPTPRRSTARKKKSEDLTPRAALDEALLSVLEGEGAWACFAKSALRACARSPRATSTSPL
jgi:hypothetical protein